MALEAFMCNSIILVIYLGRKQTLEIIRPVFHVNYTINCQCQGFVQ